MSVLKPAPYKAQGQRQPVHPNAAGEAPGAHISLPPHNGGSQMKPIIFALLCASILAALPAPSTNAFTQDQIQFGTVPPFPPPGGQLAVLEGNPLPPAEITRPVENAGRLQDCSALAPKTRERDRDCG